MRQENNTKTAVAAPPTGATVKVTAHRCPACPPGSDTPFDTQAAHADLASVNATIAAFGLTPAGPGSVHRPNA